MAQELGVRLSARAARRFPGLRDSIRWRAGRFPGGVAGGALLFSFWLACCSVGAGETSGAVPPPALPAEAPAPPAAPPEPPPAPVADNSRCFVCHANYEEEKLALTHARANVACVQCHGESRRHSTDEDNVTAPDRLYPRGHVRFLCLGCHNWVRLVANDRTRPDSKDRPDHQAVLDGTAREKRFCTDCHGEHRLGYRTRTWDKRTGRLLYRDGAPALLAPPPGTNAPPAGHAPALPGPQNGERLQPGGEFRNPGTRLDSSFRSDGCRTTL